MIAVVTRVGKCDVFAVESGVFLCSQCYRGKM